MYQEEIANLTATHLRDHIGAYLTEVNAIYHDGVKLQFPKTIETANLVGGVYNTTTDKMPAYAVDIIEYTFDGVDPEGLYLYNYSGHIAGVVTGGAEATVNAIIKRHEQAVALFVKRHLHFHQMTSQLGNDFRIIEFNFFGSAFSGAERVDEKNQRQIWIAGFRTDIVWAVSEGGGGDHA
jgi:hypothetical protein